MYRFDDWVNNRIEIHPLAKKIEEETPIWDILIQEGKITKETVIEIKKAQEQTFDQSLEINLHAFKWLTESLMKKSLDKKEFLQAEIQKLEREKADNPTEYNKSNYNKKFQALTGEDYQFVKEKWEQHKSGVFSTYHF